MTGDAVRLKGNPNWESLASGMGNRRCGGQFHPPSLDQAALRLLPEAAAVPVHIEAYVRKAPNRNAEYI